MWRVKDGGKPDGNVRARSISLDAARHRVLACTCFDKDARLSKLLRSIDGASRKAGRHVLAYSPGTSREYLKCESNYLLNICPMDSHIESDCFRDI